MRGLKLSEIKTFCKLITNRKITFKKLANIAKVKSSIYFKRKGFWGYPYILILEPTNVCNLKCPTCPTGNGLMKRPRKLMPFESFKKVIDDMGGYLVNIVLMNFGEPLLNKDFYRMVDYAHAKNINVVTCTNGHFTEAKKIVNSKMDEITVSLDGIDQETLEKFRVGADFNKVIEGIKEIVEEKGLRKTNIPIINLQFIIMKHNEHQIDRFRDLAKSLGVDKITFKALWVNSLAEAKNFLPNNPEFHRYILRENSYDMKCDEDFICTKPWSDIAISSAGSVTLCSCDFDNSIILGNIEESSIKDILSSPKSLGVRKLLLTGHGKVPICKTCAPNSNISITEMLK
ncbi:MAG: radical SAM protein [Nanoarchaeota archaeon]